VETIVSWNNKRQDNRVSRLVLPIVRVKIIDIETIVCETIEKNNKKETNKMYTIGEESNKIFGYLGYVG